MANSNLGLTPPLGWNSFDSYNASVTEAEILENADHLARRLLPFGWEYCVLDFCWSHPNPPLLYAPDQVISEDGEMTPALTMDAYGRLLPALNRFPSAASDQGLKPLGDKIHALGLKFGLHIMRGIPRQAVRANTPILGTPYHARDIADLNSTCVWLNQMYGVDMTKPGAQAYYDSLFQLYALWGVDYIKVDDIAYPYSAAEIEAVQTAIQHCGRPMLLSLSPGPTPLDQSAHVSRFANLWRISGDFWDSWPQLKEHFHLCASWAPYIQPGHWPDADMLPLGLIELRGPNLPEAHMTRFTPDEQFAFMSLCAIFRSPLMYGGHLPSLDDFTLSLLTNQEVLAVNQQSTANRVLFDHAGLAAWTASSPDPETRYLAVFNLTDTPQAVRVQLAEIGFFGMCQVRDLWQQRTLETALVEFSPQVAPHGGRLFKLTPA